MKNSFENSLYRHNNVSSATSPFFSLDLTSLALWGRQVILQCHFQKFICLWQDTLFLAMCSLKSFCKNTLELELVWHQPKNLIFFSFQLERQLHEDEEFARTLAMLDETPQKKKVEFFLNLHFQELHCWERSYLYTFVLRLPYKYIKNGRKVFSWKQHTHFLYCPPGFSLLGRGCPA